MPWRTIITAPDLTPLQALPGDEPVIYLLGPLQEDDWQRDAIDVLGQVAPDVHVASPRVAAFAGNLDGLTTWQTAAARRAATCGVLLCWLPQERRHRCSRSHAAPARFELGEWAARTTQEPIRLVVGIERGFGGATYLRQRLQQDYPRVPVCRTLRQTCTAAAELAREHFAEEVRPLGERFVPRVVP